jgi:hypothetical protein
MAAEDAAVVPLSASAFTPLPPFFNDNNGGAAGAVSQRFANDDAVCCQ